jgi:hypothetical protein
LALTSKSDEREYNFKDYQVKGIERHHQNDRSPLSNRYVDMDFVASTTPVPPIFLHLSITLSKAVMLSGAETVSMLVRVRHQQPIEDHGVGSVKGLKFIRVLQLTSLLLWHSLVTPVLISLGQIRRMSSNDNLNLIKSLRFGDWRKA